jgi:putative NADH-flavin reductase
MPQTIKAAFIGATGKAGKYLLQQLLQNGFTCRILLRNPENFHIQNSLIEIIKGDARNYDAIQQLLFGCNVVVSTLGQPKEGPPIFSSATKSIIAAMQQNNIQRYIVTTGLSVNTPFDKKGEKTKFATEWMYKNYPATTYDKQMEHDILCDSNVDWTLIRLPLIELTGDNTQTAVSLEDCPGNTISAASLANFIIQQFTGRAFIRKSPFIANA